jgi:dienelactone hydrolase
LRALGVLVVLGGLAYGQVPATDSRNTDIPNTDTHFTARSYRTLAEWQERRAHLRKQILSAAGLLPMPAKTPLHPQVFGRIENRTYSIEKVLLETLPGYYLGGNLYRPLGKPAPAGGFPAIVSPHGHWSQGRLENTAVASVPARCINLAQQGYVVFAYDMVGYNDTIQTPHEFENRDYLLWDFGPYALQLWNSIRAVDFLESLPEVNKQKIGATGASGGGTQTFSLAAVDDRIQFAAPVNMVSLIMQGGAICENAASLRFDTNNVEFASMFAPKPMIMVGATGDWTKNTATEEYPAVKAIYQLYGKPDNVEMFFQEAPHNYNQAAREAVYTFFGSRVLGLNGPIKERNIRMEQPSLMLALFNRKLPDNALDFSGLFDEWKRIAKETAESVTDHNQVREMLELTLGAEWPAKVTAETSGERFALTRPGRGDRVAGVFHPGRGANILIVNPEGADAFRRSPLYDEFVQSGRPVYVIDAFQTGAAVAPRNREAKMFLTFNRGDDANRVQDILTTLAWLNSPNAEVVGIGKAAVWSLFAAALSRQSVILNLDIPKPGSVDKDYYENFFVPGIERAGGLRAARLLTNQ